MRFRKKPVVIDAWQVPPPDASDLTSIPDWVIEACTQGVLVAQPDFTIHVKTLEDGPNGEAKHVASTGDWIVRGVKGEMYPVKPDIFAQTYENIDEVVELSSTDYAVEKVLAELRFARKKFPWWPQDPVHAAAILAEEAGELHKDVLELVYEPHKTSIANLENEAVQTAAMALRFLVNIGRYEFKPAARMPDMHEGA